MKYSHIRQCITDKGSRNSSNEFFADVLNEVADYHEPDEGNDNRLSQGGYTLKPKVVYPFNLSKKWKFSCGTQISTQFSPK